MAGIPLSWLVDITSVGVKDSFSLSKLPTLLITKYDSEYINPKWSKFYDVDSVKKAFGANTSVGKFGNNYFSVVNKMSSKPDLLNVYVWNENATPAILQGGRVASINTLKTSGAFSLTIGGDTRDVIVDLRDVVSYTDIATKLQTAINKAGEPTPNVSVGKNTNPALPNFTKATCIFDTIKQGFRISSGESGVVSISYASEPTTLTDISGLLSLTQDKGAVIYEGRDTIGSFDNVLSEINTDNGAYFVLAFDWELSEVESQTLGEFVNSSNNRFLGIINSTNATLTTQEGVSEALKGYNGIILDYFKDLKAVNGFSAGLISAIDFSQTNGNANLAFNDATRYANQAIQTQAELNTLEANLANSILEFSQIGQSRAWYGMGNIMGTLTNSANVYIGNAYLHFQLQLQFANMFDSQSFIGLRGKNNEGVLTSYIEAVFQGCVNNGIIIQGAELTTTEKQKLISVFGDKGESAVSQCSRGGYFYQIGTADLVNQTLPISIAYVANKAVKRIVITNYVLGA